MKTKTILIATAIFAFAGVIFAQTQGRDWRMSSFVDERDGQTYSAVIMPDGKTWMAQNLNFETESGSWCYDYDVANCEIYGRLYNGNVAMNVCPQGWYLPSNEEWSMLINAVSDSLTAGRKLKSQSGWNDNGNGTDDFGFTALPGGFRSFEGDFYDVGDTGLWWTSTIFGFMATDARTRLMGYDYENVFTTWNSITTELSGISVRCVRDDEFDNDW